MGRQGRNVAEVTLFRLQDHPKLFRLCKKYAQPGGHIAISIKNKSILRYAYNSLTKTHPAQKQAAILCNEGYKEFLHAEIYAYHPAADTLLVARFNKQLKPRLSKPCPICYSYLSLKNSNLKVFHT